ncbi:MAG: glutamate--tRNA ligase [Thermoplasmataceae archaeon]
MDYRPLIEKAALKNAFTHDGRADVGSVMNKILGEFPEERKNAGKLSAIVKEIVAEINAMPQEQQKSVISEKYPDIFVVEKKEQEHRLHDLKNVNAPVVMRMAPSPSGPLHLGHSRMAILNDEYVKRYGGRLILRIEDTNPQNIDPAAYDMIPKDLEWLEVNTTDIVIQSDRFDLYYTRAKELIRMGVAYLCSCDVNVFKDLLMKGEACPHRELSPETNLERFQLAIDGKSTEKSPVLVIKTDIKHPNPSVRDWIAFRKISGNHPRTGTKYSFYPMMNFSVAIDDHELGLTHVIRGSDHISNTEKQKYLFRYFGWKVPEYFHYGTISIPDSILKTSIVKKGIHDGTYSSWDDVRLQTIGALKRRGYQPETFRRYWIESGLREVNAEFSWDIFNSINRQIIDANADRFFFVRNPIPVKISGSPAILARIPRYQGKPERGFREYRIAADSNVYISKDDLMNIKDGEKIRLKDLYNVLYRNGSFTYSETEPSREKIKIIHWCPAESSAFTIERPDGSLDEGLLEPLAREITGIFQFERYGFVNKTSNTRGIYIHN